MMLNLTVAVLLFLIRNIEGVRLCSKSSDCVGAEDFGCVDHKCLRAVPGLFCTSHEECYSSAVRSAVSVSAVGPRENTAITAVDSSAAARKAANKSRTTRLFSHPTSTPLNTSHSQEMLCVQGQCHQVQLRDNYDQFCLKPSDCSGTHFTCIDFSCNISPILPVPCSSDTDCSRSSFCYQGHCATSDGLAPLPDSSSVIFILIAACALSIGSIAVLSRLRDRINRTTRRTPTSCHRSPPSPNNDDYNQGMRYTDEEEAHDPEMAEALKYPLPAYTLEPPPYSQPTVTRLQHVVA